MSKNLVSQRIYDAVRFATEAHGRQARKGTNVPYIVHPLNVGRLLGTAGCEENVVVSGILHDVIEDSTTKGESDIRGQFGERVADLVVGASEPEHDNKGWDARKNHTIHFVEFECTDEDLLAVIYADKLDNLMAIQQDLAWANDIDQFWSRFNAEREKQQWYHEGLARAFGKHVESSPALKLLATQFRECVQVVFS